MRRNYNVTESTLAFIKWRRCLILYNNNKEENQPNQCKKLYIIYDNLIENKIKKIGEKEKYIK